MPEKKSPASKPETLKVIPLSRPSAEEPRTGRPRKLKMPDLPQEIYDGMSDIEREHFDFFLNAIRQEYPDLTHTDNIFLVMAGLDYINSLRLQVQQLKSGDLVTMSRQHPGVQLRAWLDMLSVTRKARQGTRTDTEKEEKLSRLSALWSAKEN
jgi:hypothetical protein